MDSATQYSEFLIKLDQLMNEYSVKGVMYKMKIADLSGDYPVQIDSTEGDSFVATENIFLLKG